VTALRREDLAALDAVDPLAACREGFVVPDGVVYLDGNSLGALPRATAAHVARVVEQEWGEGLIRSWNTAGWIDWPLRLGEKIARVIGARPGEVVVTDSTSVNLFKLLAAALAMVPGRRVIVSEDENFPTDLYVAQGLIGLLGGRHELRLAAPDRIAGAIDRDTAVVMLTHVSYRTGAMHDMAAVTRAAHEQGALTLWDLAHSAGAVPLDLTAAGADLAVGCGYKFLNGGPGAPAFAYVAERHQAGFRQPLTGWMGHAEPFAFDGGYRPAPGIARALCGTPPVLSLAALDAGVDTVLGADIARIREKSLRLGALLVQLVEERAERHPLALLSPREPGRRGSQVSFRHAQAYPVMQALIARGVIGDFRAPDILRFGITPLYTRYVDAWDAVGALVEVLDSREWDQPHFHRRAAVT
jgi:kynureninase